jgi:hypothetical protein
MFRHYRFKKNTTVNDLPRDRETNVASNCNNLNWKLKWKLYIRSKLAETRDCFVEIPMDTNHYTKIDEEIDFTNIGKNELIFILRELSKEYSCNYFITTRSMHDSNNYYIVLTIIH